MSKLIITIFMIFTLITIVAFIVTDNIFGYPISVFEKLSIIISELAIIISSSIFIRTQKTNMMPVLVFIRKSEDIILVQNVGSGPAINVIIASKDTNRSWDPVLFQPISAGAIIDLDPVIKGKDYASVYFDVKRNIYSSLYEGNINEFHERNFFPKMKAYSVDWYRKKTKEELKRYF